MERSDCRSLRIAGDCPRPQLVEEQSQLCWLCGGPGKADPHSVHGGPAGLHVLLHAYVLGPRLRGPRFLRGFASQEHERRLGTQRQRLTGLLWPGSRPVPKQESAKSRTLQSPATICIRSWVQAACCLRPGPGPGKAQDTEDPPGSDYVAGAPGAPATPHR